MRKNRRICSAAFLLISCFNTNADSVSGSESVENDRTPIVLELPLRGQWMSPNSPGSKIPSHGTNQLGEKYALDFLQVDWERKGQPFYKESPLHYLLFGVPVSDCYCWGKEIYSPCDGEVVAVSDGVKDRQRAYWPVDLFIAFRNASSFNIEKDPVQQVAGNYIIIKLSDKVYAAFAHLMNGSVAVTVGSRVKRGQMLGKVGHSGNSTAPHLHFQLMDSCDLRIANGIPCTFVNYRVFRNGSWELISQGIPKVMERIKYP
jgi:murein DD-endopeptidase MepM/ murein hydrolase activator NlpD